ncbi:MAG: hypothetical protein VST72_09355 [Nitrospirota bacterium]|nr:hypothetical protein [Nitrospirota bacterium]
MEIPVIHGPDLTLPGMPETDRHERVSTHDVNGLIREPAIGSYPPAVVAAGKSLPE